MSKYEDISTCAWGLLLPISFVILLIAKVCGVSISWWVVTSPLWIFPVGCLIATAMLLSISAVVLVVLLVIGIIGAAFEEIS